MKLILEDNRPDVDEIIIRFLDEDTSIEYLDIAFSISEYGMGYVNIHKFDESGNEELILDECINSYDCDSTPKQLEFTFGK